MLRRNLLKTIGVWWLPPMIVQVGHPPPAAAHSCLQASRHQQLSHRPLALTIHPVDPDTTNVICAICYPAVHCFVLADLSS